MKIQTIWKEAEKYQGSLSHLYTQTGRRKYTEDEDPLPIELFTSDKAKLLESKALRNMAFKTQVFTLPGNPLIRTRRTHVDEVVACSIVTASMLGLNTDLVEAAAWGHDIGHVPLGHQGESWMAKEMGKPEFCHEIMGPIVAQKIERKGKGLNLSFECLDGMMRHSGDKAREGMTPEAWVLRFADKFAYLFHDINDIFVRMEFPMKSELKDLVNIFGETQRERTTTAICGLVIESGECKKVSFEHSDLGIQFNKLRKMMYEFYSRVTEQNVGDIMGPVFNFLDSLKIGDPWLLLALMNDKDLQMVAGEKMKDMSLFNKTALRELKPFLEEIGQIDLCNPCLDW